MNDAWVFIILGACAFLLGLRGSVRLTGRYKDVQSELIPRERLLLASLVGVSWLITLAGGYFLALSIRRSLGYPPFEWTPFTSILVASAVLFIPAGLDYVVSRIARVPWKGDK